MSKTKTKTSARRWPSIEAARAEALAQVALMLGAGGVAAGAAWQHVVNLAQVHGQPGWLAWADAAVIETTAISAGLEIRRRRRQGRPSGPWFAVLIVSVALSLACQVAEAEPSAWGWLLAAVPAVGFLVLAKAALGATVATHVEPEPAPARPARRAQERPAVTTEPGPEAEPSGPALALARPSRPGPAGPGVAVRPDNPDGLDLDAWVAQWRARGARPMETRRAAEGLFDVTPKQARGAWERAGRAAEGAA